MVFSIFIPKAQKVAQKGITIFLRITKIKGALPTGDPYLLASSSSLAATAKVLDQQPLFDLMSHLVALF
jgi:hypothetical protein